MLLTEICMERHWHLRKQTAALPIWTERADTVVDLTAAEQELLEQHGAAALDEKLRCQGEFAFPALDLPAPRPLVREVKLDEALLVVPENDPFHRRMAAALSSTVAGGIACCTDREAKPECKKPLLLLGNSNTNRLIRELAARQLAFANGLVPGRGGWMIQTVAGGSQLVLAADAESLPELLSHWRSCLVRREGGWFLTRADHTAPGAACRERLGTAPELLRSIALHISRLGEAAATFDGMSREIIRSFDSGGKAVNRDNGHPTIPNMIRMHWAYRYTGDRRFLRVFRDTLFGLVEYFLATPDGASYPSDYDFYLGNLINCWSDVEADELFSESDRLLIASFLLASCRLIDKYHRIYWPVRPELLRFNHETFPALSLEWAARYFETFTSSPEFTAWHEHAALVFFGMVERFGRQTENSSSYQWIVPSQKFVYDSLTSPERAAQRAGMREVVAGIRAATDPLGMSVPYGDGEPVVATVAVFDLLRAAAALNPADPLPGTLLKRCFDGMGREPFLLLPQPGWGNLFAPDEPEEAEADGAGDWEVLPLAGHVRLRNEPGMPPEWLADKIAWRSGWDREAQYLLFEPYSCDAHAHFDMNSILAYTHHRRWGLVDNGYGKPSGVENMAEAYDRHETGPNCHNTLIFRDQEGNVLIPPPFAAVIARRRVGDCFLLETVLGNIGGWVWSRAVLLKRDGFLLVADRVRRTDEGSVSSIECQFNALGKTVKDGPEAVLEQQGIRTFLTLCGDGEFRSGEYRTAGYDAVLGGRFYPWAQGAIRQFSRVAECTGQREFRFTALCELTPEHTAGFRLREDGIYGTFGEACELTGHAFGVDIAPGRMMIRYPAAPLLPEGLTLEKFGPCGPRPCRRGLE